MNTLKSIVVDTDEGSVDVWEHRDTTQSVAKMVGCDSYYTGRYWVGGVPVLIHCDPESKGLSSLFIGGEVYLRGTIVLDKLVSCLSWTKESFSNNDLDKVLAERVKSCTPTTHYALTGSHMQDKEAAITHAKIVNEYTYEYQANFEGEKVISYEVYEVSNFLYSTYEKHIGTVSPDKKLRDNTINPIILTGCL